jgi:hypothetical protein
LVITAGERDLRAVHGFHGDGHDLERAALPAHALAGEPRNAQLDRRTGANDRAAVHDDVLPDVAVDGVADAEFAAVRSDALVERTEHDRALRDDQLLGVSERRCGNHEGT